MKIAGDTHTHTVACQHAYSTLLENCDAARKAGHRFLATTDHGPAMEGSTHMWYFGNLKKFVPQEMDGLVVLCGCEANLLGDGSLDIDDNILKGLDWVIASMHRGLMPQGLSKENYTNLWLKVMENPYVDCIGHIEHTAFQCDYEAVMKSAASHGKIVEVNNASPTSRPGSEDNIRRVVKLCKELGVKLVLSSDTHFATGIGRTDWSEKVVTEAGYPQADIVNLEYSRMAAWLANKKGLILPE